MACLTASTLPESATGKVEIALCSSLRRKLLSLIEKCRERNQRNGAIVKARREQVLEALKLLRGSELELYNSSGLKPASSGIRPLGSA